MAAIAFDTLKFTKRLREAGVPEKQAEAEAEAVQEALREIIGDFEKSRLAEVSTKLDIEELDAKVETTRDFMRRDIKESELKLEAKIAETNANLVKWVVSASLVQFALIAALLPTMLKGG
jgi:hypothetical protein